MKRLIGICAAVAAATAFATMERATPESQGVSSGAVLNWIDGCEKTFGGGKLGALHGFVIVRHGKVVAEGSWKPFDTLNETHMHYSVSKSFTSAAVGLLVDAGKLDLDERVVDVFTNECPSVVSKNLSQMRVRDLLTMNIGSRFKDAQKRDPSGDWAKAFLANAVERAPGTVFQYDSAATYMLAEIVERRTGMPMMDLLQRKIFDKIGIEKAWTTYSPTGVPCGGWGMNMTTRELARFGQLFLQKGTWDGERLLSSDWVSLATARQTWSGRKEIGAKAADEGDDWEQGYGFQFWRCRYGAYRAGGAAGQFAVVMPEQDMVVAIHAGLSDMKKEIELVWEHFLPAVKDAPLPENAAEQARLADRLANLELKPLSGGFPLVAAKFEFKENPRGFRSLDVAPTQDGGIVCKLVTRAGEQIFPAGNGSWRAGTIRIDTERYENLGAYIGDQKVMASCGRNKDGTAHIRAYLTGTISYLDFFARDGKLTGEFWGMEGCKLESK